MPELRNATDKIDWAKETLTALLTNQATFEDEARTIKANLEAIRAELLKRTGAELEGAIDAAGKQAGTFHFMYSGTPLTAEIDKKVEWDTDKLLPVCGAMEWATALKIFKIAISVPEKVYSVLPAAMSLTPEQEAMFKEIEAARTVVYGNAKIKARKPS